MYVIMFLTRMKQSKFYNNNRRFLEDGAKQTITFSYVLVNIVNLWPLSASKTKNVTFSLLITSFFIHEAALIVYICTSVGDVDDLLKSVSSIAIGIQTMTKATVFFYKSPELGNIIKTIRDEFWPSDLVSPNTDKEIRQDSFKLFFVFVTQYATAVAFLHMYFIIPLTKSARELPHNSWYPFDVTKTPTYEILFALQFFQTIYICLNTVTAYDTLYCAVCGNIIAQFRLLCEIIEFIGTGKEAEIVGKLIGIPGIKYRAYRNEDKDQNERKLLIICIEHHQKLIKMSNRLNTIFGNGHLVQLCASVMGICTTCYKMTIEASLDNLVFSISFYASHVAQLLMYCAASSELSYWSTQFSKHAFNCLWYTKEYKDVRKCLRMVIMRSQRAISMNTFGLFELNYASFLSVMRFTFSLYTFLKKMAK